MFDVGEGEGGGRRGVEESLVVVDGCSCKMNAAISVPCAILQSRDFHPEGLWSKQENFCSAQASIPGSFISMLVK